MLDARGLSFAPGIRYLLVGMLLALFLVDTGYSGWMYYHQPLDGDMAWNILPDPDVAYILQDPLGVRVWREGATYPNPNRFFCHWLMREYYLHVPYALQYIMDPIRSVYWAGALVKISVHVAILYLLTVMVTGRRNPLNIKFLIVLGCLFPLMQINGYRSYMGVVDGSTTYTFFYALPAVFLLMYLLPFARWLRGGSAVVAWWRMALLLPLGVVVCLSGPLNPGAVGVLAILAIAQQIIGRGRRMPRGLVILGIWVAGWAAYSLLLGRYNSLTIENALPLLDRYARLPRGIAGILTGKLGYGLLVALVLINYLIGRKAATSFDKLYRYILLFSLLYLLLLPLGGYREYREFIVRYDTVLPVTLALFFLYGYTTLRLLRSGVGRWYYLIPIAAAVVYTLADKPRSEAYACEVASLRVLSETQRNTVVFPHNCSVVWWGPIHDPATSLPNARLLQLWNITDTTIRYYNHPTS